MCRSAGCMHPKIWWEHSLCESCVSLLSLCWKAAKQRQLLQSALLQSDFILRSERERGKKKKKSSINSFHPSRNNALCDHKRVSKATITWIDTPSLLLPRLDSLVRGKRQTQIRSFVTFTYNCGPCVWLPLEQTEEIKSSTEAEARVTEREGEESGERPPLG